MGVRIAMRTAIVLPIMAVALVGCGSIEVPDTQRVTEPSSALSPVQVVEAQLDALRRNRDDDEGIAILYNFFSPTNRERTGPLERFRRRFDNSVYAPLLNHREFEVYAPTVVVDLAMVPVRVIASDGEQIDYVFVLTRQQDEPYESMWMTDAVQMHSPDDQDSEASAEES